MHVGAGIAHGADYPVEGNEVFAVTAQGHLRGVDRLDRGDGVALDARHLHQADRNRVVKALDYFQEKGWIELESKQMTEVYSLLVSQVDAQALSLELHQYFSAHERGEIVRIHVMLALFSSDTCLSYRLAQYFGDQQAPQQCGHCSVCAGQVAQLPEPPPLTPLVDKHFDALCGAFIHRHQEYTASYPPAERLTRFLCGISVPMFTKMKARAIQGFAALENYPYAEVREWAEQHLQVLSQ